MTTEEFKATLASHGCIFRTIRGGETEVLSPSGKSLLVVQEQEGDAPTVQVNSGHGCGSGAHVSMCMDLGSLQLIEDGPSGNAEHLWFFSDGRTLTEALRPALCIIVGEGE